MTPDLLIDVAVNAEKDSRLDANLAARGHEIGDHIALAVAPGGLLQAVRVKIALPLHEAVEVRGGEDGIARAGSLGGGEPLVGVQFVRLVEIGIPRFACSIVLRGVTGGDDLLVLGQCDGPLLFEVDGGPLALGNHRSREPVHIEREVVRFAEVGVRGNGSLFQHGQEVLGLGLDEQAGADEVERLVLGRDAPAKLGGAGLELEDGVEDVLLGAGGDGGIAVLEVHAGQAEVHGGLFAGLVHGHEQALGLGLVLGPEAGEGFGGVVEGVIDAFATEEETVTQFHVHASSILPGRRIRR